MTATPPEVADLPLPEDWERVVHPAEGTELVVLEPPREVDGTSLFRANVVVTALSAGGLAFRDWQGGTDELLDRMLTDYLVLDLEQLEVEGHPAGRRLAHHVGPDGEALTMEQWFVLVDDVGHTLTATVDTWRWAGLRGLVAAAVDAWRPAGLGTGEARR